VAFLAAEAFHFSDRETAYADFGQRFAHFVELERLEYRLDSLHCAPRFVCQKTGA
jgi:hypothetical protein